MFIKFVIFCTLCLICQSYKIDKEEISIINGKKLIRQIRDVNVTQIENTASDTTKLYSQWSKWSPCRRCTKFRRKVCQSLNCGGGEIFEKRRCNTARCKRKTNKKSKKSIKESDDWYYNWSDWSACSHQCITWRQRYCKFPGKCLHNRDVEMGYCYRENTPCHTWIQSVLDRQAQAQNRKYTYDIDTNTNSRKRKKVKYKPRKCGIPYRMKQKKKHGRYSTRSMLKIMGGHLAKRKRWPWHVALLNYNKEVYCGGTLISPGWVLTAAHCLRRTLYVRLNEYDTSYSDGTEIEYRIIKMYRHPRYNKITSDSDIAMLKLPKSVPLPYACLPKNMSLPTGHNCTIVGWGKTSPHDYNGSNILREAQIPIVDKSVCEHSYRFYEITDNMLCAGYRNGGVDTCLGDSGGGFMCLPQGKRLGWTIQGITSFGEGCGKRNKYGIYTDVRKYLSWIQHKL